MANQSGTRFETLTLRDGRQLDVALGGAEDGELALVAQHGTPGEASRYRGWAPAVGARGLRFVSFSRPGYASSTRLPGRDVASVASDIVDLLDQLGIDRFVTLGGSGGGPHAIAAAALLPDRCLAATALVTLAPHGARGLDWFGGMDQVNLDEFGAALQGEEALRAWMRANGEAMRGVTADDIVAALGGDLCEADRETLTGAYAEETAFGFRRALADSYDGWVDDDLAFVKPWGFDLDAIEVPVTIWQGERDVLVPWSHGRWLADEIPTCRFVLAEGHGHFSLGSANRTEILDDLLRNASRL